MRLSFLQASDVAVSVPNSLVVTLERVLGNETLGKVECFQHFFDCVLCWGFSCGECSLLISCSQLVCCELRKVKMG